VEGIGHRLHELDALSAGAREEASGVRAELARGLEQVAQRIEAVERERAAAAHELSQALAASAEERESLAAGSRLLEERVQGFSEGLDGVSGRLAALSRAVEETGQGYEERRQEVGALRTEFDEETGRLDSHVAKIEQVLAEVTAKLSILETSFGPDPAVVTRLEVLAQAVEAQAAAVAAATEGVESGGREIAELREKAHEGERRLDSVASGLRGAMDALAGQIDSVVQNVELSTAGRPEEDARLEGLDARVEQTAARVEALAAELGRTVEALSSREADQDAAERYATLERRLDALAADLDAKSASKETDLMLGKILLRVDELTKRLEELEQTGGTEPARDLGDLELRIEQAEEAARENRESVLVQLERLASRVEYRLDRLESEPPTPATAPQPEAEGPQARVVPIRGNEA
jgi:DNA repair exonuclease SbcCD ATPase subunit